MSRRDELGQLKDQITHSFDAGVGALVELKADFEELKKLLRRGVSEDRKKVKKVLSDARTMMETMAKATAERGKEVRYALERFYQSNPAVRNEELPENTSAWSSKGHSDQRARTGRRKARGT